MPRTEAGKRLLSKLDDVGRRSQDTSFPTAFEDIDAIEEEVRREVLTDRRAAMDDLEAGNLVQTPVARDWTDGPFTEAEDEALASVMYMLGWMPPDASSAARVRAATSALRRALNQHVNAKTAGLR